MNQILCDFYSESLKMNTSVTVLLPSADFKNDHTKVKPNGNMGYKTLYLLHGYTGDHTSWLRYARIEKYARGKQLAVIMPSAYNSNYANMAHGVECFTYLSEELPFVMKSMFPLSEKQEDNYVAGFSMGGRGAFLWALSKPDTFALAGCLSGALDINALVNYYISENLDGTIKRFTDTFGDLDKIKDGEHDICEIIRKLKASNSAFPKLYMSCGKDDPFYESQFLSYVSFAKETGIDLINEDFPGGHETDVWDLALSRFMKLI